MSGRRADALLQVRKSKRIVVILVALAVWLPLASSAEQRAGTSASKAWSDARQLVLVTTEDWDASRGSLRTFARTGQGWEAVATAIPVVVGRAGSAWGIGLHPPQPGPRKQEGDGRSPAGVFALGIAFGYAESASTALNYVPMDANDYCIDVKGSPLYNRIVDASDVGADAIAGSTEPMRRDLHVDGDQRYKLGFVIEHNPDNEAGAGSCIFAHLWKSAETTTAGCTAMPEPAMQKFLAWLRPDAHPIFVLLPQRQYDRLRVQWELPSGVGPPQSID